jgi:hypothetical protein
MERTVREPWVKRTRKLAGPVRILQPVHTGGPQLRGRFGKVGVIDRPRRNDT